MNALERQTIHKHYDRVEQYIQDTARANAREVTTENIKSLFTGVRQLLLHILLLFKHFDAEFKRRIQYTSLKRSYSRLSLWHDTHQWICGTMQGDLPPDLADTATRYLKDISQTLVDRFLHLASKESVAIAIESLDCYVQDVASLVQKLEACGEDGSDDSCSYDYDSYTEVAEDLKTDTTCLSGLNLLINRSSIEPQIAEAVTGVVEEQWELYRPYCDRISNRFPDGTECLISRLGKANYDRYIRWIQRNNEVGDESDEPEESNETGQLQKAHTVVVSSFHDSGLGSSVPSKSSYAETVMSYGADGNGQSVRVPPLSEEAKKGIPFTCVACHKTVTMRNNAVWKRHLYEDLCPWMCLEPECPSGHTVFSQRDDWLAHLSFEHKMAPAWVSFQCPLCRSNIEPGETSIIRHLGGHLEEIALGSLPLKTERDDEDDDGLESLNSLEGSEQATSATASMLQQEELQPRRALTQAESNYDTRDASHASDGYPPDEGLPPAASTAAAPISEREEPQNSPLSEAYDSRAGPDYRLNPESPPPELEEATIWCCYCRDAMTFWEIPNGIWVCGACGHGKTDSCDCH